MNNMIIRSGDFEIQERNAEERTIVGTITTNAVDRYREIVEPGGAVLENFNKNPVVLLNHNSWGVPIGRNLWIKKSENGLVAKTQFAPTLEGEDLYKLYDDGYMKAWSIGFIPKKWEDADLQEAGYRRKYTLWELLEYSGVTIPANPEAVTNALKCAESPRVREMLEREVNTDERIRELLLTLEKQGKSIEELREEIKELTGSQAIAQRIMNIETVDDDEHKHTPIETENTDDTPLELPATPRLTNDMVARAVVEAVSKRMGVLK